MTFLDGNEAWTMYARQVRSLEAWYLKCIRCTSGVSWRNRFRYDELLRRLDCHSMATLLARRELCWIATWWGWIKNDYESRYCMENSDMTTEMLNDRRNVIRTTIRYYFTNLRYHLIPWSLTPHSEADGAPFVRTEPPSARRSTTSASGNGRNVVNNFEIRSSHLKTAGSPT